MSLLMHANANVKSVLIAAQDEARSMGHGYIGTEHLLIAMLLKPATPGVAEAARQGATPQIARHHAQAAFERTTNAATFVADEASLATIGVNLTEVRLRAEAEFGPGAVAMRVGAPPFTPRVKQALDNAKQSVVDSARDLIDVDDLLLGMLMDEESVASRALSVMCVDLPAVEAAAAQD